MKIYNESLADMCPELALQWHPIKNGDLKPTDVTPCSGKKVWWYLPYDDPNTGKHFDFEWEAVIQTRTKGANCPYLTGYKAWPGFNDLATVNPQLASEWHPTKNGDLTPSDVMPFSNKKVWWYMPYDDPATGKHFEFEWQADISNRVLKNQGCPFLYKSNARIWIGFNDLQTTHPHIASEWHPTKNRNLTPLDVLAGSTYMAWWYLPYDDPITCKHFDFEWQSTVDNRTHKNTSCPYLSNPAKAIYTGFNDLATRYPELCKEWDYEKNTIKPTEILPGSNLKVWWKLEYFDDKTGKIHIFEWEEIVNDRVTNNLGCPYLSNHKIKSDFNSLAALRPDLLLEWDYSKNNNLGIYPDQIGVGSGKKAWWKIEVDGKIYEWKASINARNNGHTHPALSQSHLEKAVVNILDESNIQFKQEICFKNCLSTKNKMLRFDFAINSQNIIIECDGIQHFKPVDVFQGAKGFEKRVLHDNIKNQYCKDNNLYLLRIPYIYDTVSNRGKIKQLVLDFIQTKQVPDEIVEFYKQFDFSCYR